MDVNCSLLCLQDQNVIDVSKKLVPNSREISLKLAGEYYFNEHQMLIFIKFLKMDVNIMIYKLRVRSSNTDKAI